MGRQRCSPTPSTGPMQTNKIKNKPLKRNHCLTWFQNPESKLLTQDLLPLRMSQLEQQVTLPWEFLVCWGRPDYSFWWHALGISHSRRSPEQSSRTNGAGHGLPRNRLEHFPVPIKQLHFHKMSNKLTMRKKFSKLGGRGWWMGGTQKILKNWSLWLWRVGKSKIWWGKLWGWRLRRSFSLRPKAVSWKNRLSLKRDQSLFYQGLQLTEWGPPTLWKAICLTQSSLI